MERLGGIMPMLNGQIFSSTCAFVENIECVILSFMFIDCGGICKENKGSGRSCPILTPYTEFKVSYLLLDLLR